MNKAVIEILTEELSMENFLREILPHILPIDYQVDVNCFIRPHEGKSHLKKSIPMKIKAYPKYGYPVKVLIIHDQDANDCVQLKKDLLKLSQAGSKIPVVIRIACKELENWYLGDMQAIEKVYPETRATSLVDKAKYRNPDNVFGAYELQQMTKNFSKTYASREIPKHMLINNNKSNSFNHLISGLNKLLAL